MNEREDYLFDKGGDADPEVVRLERLLGGFAYRPSAPPPRVRRFARALRYVCALAAGWIIALLLTSKPDAKDPSSTNESSRPLPGTREFGVTALAGLPRIGDAAAGDGAVLRVGELLETDAASSARVELRGLGRLDVAPSSKLRLLAVAENEQRFALDQGEVTALTWAPPRLLFIETPAAVAVDLGCAYVLKVDARGDGMLSVTSGYVAFERDGRESLVPRGASCATRKDRGPGTPRFDDATDALKAALDRFDFGDAGGALDVVLDAARERDTLTLWHLLPRTEGIDRKRVLGRCAEFVPPPDGVRPEKIFALDGEALAAWRAALRARW